jgi:DNA replication and repair protein RecF
LTIQSLKLKNFRNLRNVSLSSFSAGINYLVGPNGSGKTSFLEALYFLSLGRSFRTNNSKHAIMHETDNFTVFSEILPSDHSQALPLGLSKNRQGETSLKFSGDANISFTELARMLPMRVISPHDENLFECSPSIRRKWLDWGVFHVEHSFLSAWRYYCRALKQKNQALKDQRAKKEILLWNQQIIEYGMILNKLRSDYVAILNKKLPSTLKNLYEIENLNIHYYQGWDKQKTLETALNENIDKEYHLGYSISGPHRADLRIKHAGHLALEVLSRGQQKVLSCAFQLLQGEILHEIKERKCIYLVDDIASELDLDFERALFSSLFKQNGQFFVTSLSENNKLAHITQHDCHRFSIFEGEIENITT